MITSIIADNVLDGIMLEKLSELNQTSGKNVSGIPLTKGWSKLSDSQVIDFRSRNTRGWNTWVIGLQR